MATLGPEFAQAIRHVTVRDEKLELAIAAHTEIRELLKADEELREWGINPFLIGSYGRQTARYPGKDVDVFLRFTELSARHDPGKIYNAVQRVLVAEYGLKDEDPNGRVTLQARSLKIDFPDPEEPGRHFVLRRRRTGRAPARPLGHPQPRSQGVGQGRPRWIKTDPIQFDKDTNDLSIATWSPQVGGDNAYRPVVRLLRQVRHVHLGTSVQEVCLSRWRRSTCGRPGWCRAPPGLSCSPPLSSRSRESSPSTSERVARPRVRHPDEARARSWCVDGGRAAFNGLATVARQALEADRCLAAKIWRDILGTNDRGQVLMLPDGCDANGFPLDAISAVTAVGSDQPRGFASPTAPFATGADQQVGHVRRRGVRTLLRRTGQPGLLPYPRHPDGSGAARFDRASGRSPRPPG